MVHAKIIHLKQRLIKQSSRVESILKKVRDGVINGNRELLEDISIKLDLKVQRKEQKIDEQITGILALYHPEAKDLRGVLMMFRINYELEKISGICSEIAQTGLGYPLTDGRKYPADLASFFDTVYATLKESISSFIDEDVERSYKILSQVQSISALYDTIFSDAVGNGASGVTVHVPVTIVQIASCLKHIYMICVSIASETVYIVEGNMIRLTSMTETASFPARC